MRYNNAEHTGSFDINGSLILPVGVTGSIANPVSGSLIFDTNDNELYIWIGEWQAVATT